MGLVTVALLTLAPLALRPVRLACLIHAANVHSEPGSNPSKVGMTQRPFSLRAIPPQTERVEESNWSHRGVSSRLPARRLTPLPVSRARPHHRGRKPCGPVAPTACRRLPSRVHKQLAHPRSTGLSKNRAARRRFRPEQLSPCEDVGSGRHFVSTVTSFRGRRESYYRLPGEGQHPAPGILPEPRFSPRPFRQIALSR